ncbi:hypothetical protein EON65_29275, partial [archaeon]
MVSLLHTTSSWSCFIPLLWLSIRRTQAVSSASLPRTRKDVETLKMEEDEHIDIIHDSDLAAYAVADGIRKPGNWLEMLVRAGRSTGPKEVLLKLAINRHLLQLQLAAVQIQTHYRRYAAQIRVSIIKRRLELFHRITAQIASIMMEEIVLTMALEMSIDIVESRDQLQLMKSSMGRAMEQISLEIVDSVTNRFIFDVVKELITEATDAYLLIVKAKPIEADTLFSTSNPLIKVTLSICEEVSDSYMRPVVIEVCVTTRSICSNYLFLIDHHLTYTHSALITLKYVYIC